MTHSPKSRFETQLAKAAGGTLSAEERARMRAMLAEYAAMKPVRAPIVPRERVVRGFWVHAAFSARFAFAFVLILAIGSGSVAYAAEGTLPGDLLYPVKVDVTEPVRTALQTTPAAEASWQMTLATRRIEEATTLASHGALSTSTEETLATRFDESANAADRAVAAVGTSSPDEASIARTTFTVRLSAYRAVLAKLDADRHTSSTSPLQAALGIRIAANATSDERPALLSALATTSASSSGSRSEADLSKIGVAVNASLDTSAELLGSLSQKLSASTSAAARNEYARISALAEHGKDLEAKGDDSGALAAYRDSLSSAAQFEVFTRAAAAYKVDVFPSSNDANGATTTVSAAHHDGFSGQKSSVSAQTSVPTLPLQSDEETSENHASSSSATTSGTIHASSSASTTSIFSSSAHASSQTQTQAENTDDETSAPVIQIPVPVPTPPPPILHSVLPGL